MKKYTPAIVIFAVAALLTFLGWHDHMQYVKTGSAIIAIAAVGVAAYLTQTFWYFNKPGGQTASASKVSAYVIGALVALIVAAWVTLGTYGNF